ncbi:MULTISPECIES: IclR family transcriptional regulator [Streptosporangium]|uniref:IclR family acetate operon transcriptional repressor n=1 Tax=Streptosporangium brasiliense TaxID=47480 RepID=A0ABT9R5F5_9ACTN|nr:IclR family transcriptional regulator [Streptosporangium brasiliense]MDP9864476.1 IclR family acetate operon transcriptional repressor [Streptosporangium brasiliense]
MGEAQSPVGSVDRALLILQEIGRHSRGMTLDELATRLGLPKSSLHRLLGALKHRGFAAQPEPSGPYFLGSEMLATAFRFHETMDLRAIVRPLLLRLSEEFAETVHMATLDGGEVVYLDKVEAVRSITMTSVVGGRNAAHCTGVGKALLAWTYPTDEAVKAWAERYGPLAAPSRNTITSPAKLAAHLAQIRERGYALDLEENEPGVRCVAAPVFMGKPTPVAAVSVTALKDRMPPARMEEVGAALRQAVAEQL